MLDGFQQPLAFSVRIFLPDGDPDGVKLIEKSNWSGCGLVIPRALFSETKSRDEVDRTGVYVLVGPPDRKHLPMVYIGEGDPVRPRLESHAKLKDFWTHAVVFVSKDQNLNKAHIQHLETRLIRLATEAKRCELDNGNVPKPPSLSAADTAEAEGFLANVLLCMPILGYGFFERAPVPEPDVLSLFLQAKGVGATGFEASQGFIVREGSTAVKHEVRSIHAYLHDLRRELIDQSVLVDTGQFYRLSQDYTFSSPSTAAGVMLGRSANGRMEWKTSDGRTLKSIQNAELDE